jgi:hypothetical protein
MERIADAPAIPEGHFHPEGYLSDGSEEYLDQFLAVVEQMGLNPKELIFSGFDGTPLKHGWPPSKLPTIFGMNQAGWREASHSHSVELSPAEYAMGQDAPCIGLYDKNLLAEAYTYDFPEEVEDDIRLDLNNVKKGRDLAEIDNEEALEEAFIHKDYPIRTPDDALLGVIFLHE